MKNSTVFVGFAPAQRIRQALRANRTVLRQLAAGLCGFLYARAGILGVTGSFGGALVAGVGWDCTLPACAGAVLGYLLVADPARNMGFAALGVGAALAKLLLGRARWERHPWAPAAAAGLCTALVGMPALLLTAAQATDYLILAAQCGLAVATASFVSRLFVAGRLVLSHRGRMADISLLVCLCILAAGMVGFSLFGVSLGRAAAVLCTVAAGYALGGGAGAAAGTAAGLAVSFVSGNFGSMMALYSLGGLMAGAFRPMGRMGSAAAFILCGGFALLGASEQLPLAALVEIMAGTVVFMALPEALLRRAARAFAPEGADDAAGRRAVARRLDSTVAALEEICGATRKVAQHLEHSAEAHSAGLTEVVAARVCRRCPKNMACWVQSYGATARALGILVDQMRKEGAADPQLLPPEFLERCPQAPLLAAAVQEEYRGYVVREGERRRVGRVRALVTDQFEGLAMFLSGLRDEVQDCASADPVLTARVRDAFSRWGAEPLALTCIRGRERRLQVEARLPAAEAEQCDPRALARLVGEAAGRSFAQPVCQTQLGEVRVTLRERPAFKVAVEAGQSSQKEGTICGDTWRTFCTEDGRCHIILSDGMGSGGGAALDSAMAVSLLSRLIKAGADYDSALRLVNSALLVKSGRESLATVDAAAISLYTGRADFYKAGAAPTVVRRGRRGGSIESTSVPAGILSGVAFEHSTLTLDDGDWVVMVSDGATACGVDWITDEVVAYRGSTPSELAGRLARAARLRRDDGRQDDITVICALVGSEGC